MLAQILRTYLDLLYKSVKINFDLDMKLMYELVHWLDVHEINVKYSSVLPLMCNTPINITRWGFPD